MSETNSFDVLKNMRLLESEDPKERGHAIIFLSKMRDDERIRDVLQYTADTDPDPRVRDLAQRAIHYQPEPQKQQPLAAANAMANSVHPIAPWNCKYCNTEGNTGDTCPNCGASYGEGRASPIRPLELDQLTTMPEDQDERPFILFPENQAFVAGKTNRLAGQLSSLWVLALAAGIVIVLLVMGALAIPNWYDAQELERNGVVTQGSIVDRRSIIDNDGGETTWYITYSFYVTETNTAYRSEKQASRSIYNKFPTGSTAEVRYLPSDPDNSRLEADNNTYGNSRSTVIVGVGLIVLLAIGLVIVREVRQRSTALARKGQLLRGEVVSCTAKENDDGDLTVKLRYHFFNPDGRELMRLETRSMANDLKDRRLPRPGQAVVVLYLNDKTFRVM